MPKVKFLQDFQGKETREVFYKAGQVVDLPDNSASVVVKDGRALFFAEAITEDYPIPDYIKGTPVALDEQITKEEVAEVPPTPKKRSRK